MVQEGSSSGGLVNDYPSFRGPRFVPSAIDGELVRAQGILSIDASNWCERAQVAMRLAEIAPDWQRARLAPADPGLGPTQAKAGSSGRNKVGTKQRKVHGEFWGTKVC